MQPRPFAEVLDEALGAVTRGPAIEYPPVGGFTYQPANSFLFFTLPAPAGPRIDTPGFGVPPRHTQEPSTAAPTPHSVIEPTAQSTGPSTGGPTNAPTTEPSAEPKERWSHARRPGPAVPPLAGSRPARILTEAQHRALDVLMAFDAKLTADFTAKDLRREYRLLALRLHPDRHQARTEVERALLSRGFADASASYRCLLTSVESGH